MFDVGTHLVQICNYALVDGEKPQLWIEFETQDGKRMKWYGSLTHPVGKEITMKNLVTLGFNGDWDAISSGLMTCFDIEKEFEVVVEPNSYTNKSGEEVNTVRIKYINDPEKPRGQRATPESALKVVKGLNLKGEFAKAKKEMGATTTTHKVNATTGEVTEEDIPF